MRLVPADDDVVSTSARGTYGVSLDSARIGLIVVDCHHYCKGKVCNEQNSGNRKEPAPSACLGGTEIYALFAFAFSGSPLIGSLCFLFCVVRHIPFYIGIRKRPAGSYPADPLIFY